MPLRNRKEFNGQDDWLKKQLKKEKKTSVWDFDSDVLQKKKEKRIDDQSEIWFMIDFFIAVIMAYLNMHLGNGAYQPTVILILLLCPGVFLWMGLFKGRMTRSYLIIIALIAILLELRVLFLI